MVGPSNKFECDKNKARSNYKKHGIRFTEGCRIFDGYTLTDPSKKNDASVESRYVSIGSLEKGIVIVLVWTERNGNVRVISVRKASRREREGYNAHIEKTLS